MKGRLIEKLQERRLITRAEATELYEVFIECMTEVMEERKPQFCAFPGLGSFRYSYRRKTTVKTPQGDVKISPATWTVNFKASPELKELINQRAI